MQWKESPPAPIGDRLNVYMPRRGVMNQALHPPFWSNPDPLIWTDMRGGLEEKIGREYVDLVQKAYKGNGIIFALILARAILFSQARFMWREYEDGRPGELHDNENLRLLRRPWPNGTTGELLFAIEQDVSIAGNSYWAKVPAQGDRPERLRRLRPDWLTIHTGSPTGDPFHWQAEPIKYTYLPKGDGKQREPEDFFPWQIVHYSPIPDPDRQWLGQSWLTPVIDEIRGDKAATKHKLKYFERGATGGLLVSYDKNIAPDRFEEMKKGFREEYEGLDNAYKSYHIGGALDVKSFGADLRQIEFKVTQGAGETRLAAAARVPPALAGFSEGLAGSTLNTGNFSAARRMFVDGFGVWAWSGVAAAFESILEPPGENFELDYDARNIPFMREDAKEEALILKENAQTLETLYRAAYTPESSVEAVKSNDISKLVHTGAQSVQTQGSTAA